MPDRQTTEYSATQLVYSIKFKLSHAIKSTQKLHKKTITFSFCFVQTTISALPVIYALLLMLCKDEMELTS